jgi:hypothetical protein
MIGPHRILTEDLATAPAQIPDARISVCHSVRGIFAASGTIIMSNEQPYAAVDIILANSTRRYI